MEEHLTDVGNARRFVRLFSDELRYSAALGWLVWDGRVWRRDTKGSVIERAKATTAQMYQEAGAASSDARRHLARWAATSESDARIRAMVNLARSDPKVT